MGQGPPTKTVLVVGWNGVGKTSLVTRICRGHRVRGTDQRPNRVWIVELGNRRSHHLREKQVAPLPTKGVHKHVARELQINDHVR